MSVFDEDEFFIDQFDDEDLEIDDLLYRSNRLDNCILEECEYNSFYDGSIDHIKWKEHATKECIISFNGSKKRVASYPLLFSFSYISWRASIR